MDECPFCHISNQRIICENEYFFSMFDENPISPGHCIIIPKKHIVSIFDFNELEWLGLRDAVEQTKKIIESTNKEKLYKELAEKNYLKKSKEFCEIMLNHKGINANPDGYNIGNNDGEAAGRTVHHFHLHIIPRYTGDVEHPEGGIRHIIPKLANYTK